MRTIVCILLIGLGDWTLSSPINNSDMLSPSIEGETLEQVANCETAINCLPNEKVIVATEERNQLLDDQTKGIPRLQDYKDDKAENDIVAFDPSRHDDKVAFSRDSGIPAPLVPFKKVGIAQESTTPTDASSSDGTPTATGSASSSDGTPTVTGSSSDMTPTGTNSQSTGISTVTTPTPSCSPAIFVSLFLLFVSTFTSSSFSCITFSFV